MTSSNRTQCNFPRTCSPPNRVTICNQIYKKERSCRKEKFLKKIRSLKVRSRACSPPWVHIKAPTRTPSLTSPNPNPTFKANHTSACNKSSVCKNCLGFLRKCWRNYSQPSLKSSAKSFSNKVFKRRSHKKSKVIITKTAYLASIILATNTPTTFF